MAAFALVRAAKGNESLSVCSLAGSVSVTRWASNWLLGTYRGPSHNDFNAREARISTK
jgi:hypothetical protein